MRRLVYALQVALGAGGLSFLVLLALGPLTVERVGGEAWEGQALVWFFVGLPLIVLGAVASVFVVPAYDKACSGRRIRIFAVTVVAVAALGYVPHGVFALVALLGVA